MAIKKKSLLTDNIPQSLTTPAFGQSVAVPFAINFPANRNIIPGDVPNPTAYYRPTQLKGFDITVTNLTQPNPIYLNDLNGLFYLYSNVISDLCGGTPIQFDPNYLTARTNAGLTAGYQLDAILFSYPNNAWYRATTANPDNSINSTTPTSNWKQITTNNPTLVQQGRLTGSGSPYGDTIALGSQTLYFRPTYDGNLISLWNGTSWITQSLPATDLQLSISGLNGNYDVYVANTPTGLILITNAWNNATPPVPTGRTQQNGRWVNSGILGTTPQLQALLVGSINVAVVPNVANSGVVQSWYGNRSIFNVYNQIALGLLASQILATGKWAYGNTQKYHNQNNNNTNGTGRFTFLIDPLYVKTLTCAYSGLTNLNGNGDGGNIGIVLNTNLPDGITPYPTVTLLSGFIGARFSSNSFEFSGSIQNNMSYNYQFNNQTPTLPTGLNYIQKIEISTADSGGFGYFNDSIGLISEYWG